MKFLFVYRQKVDVSPDLYLKNKLFRFFSFPSKNTFSFFATLGVFSDNKEHRVLATLSCQQLTLCFIGTRAQPQVQECGRLGKGYFPAVSQRSDVQPGGLSGEATEFLSFESNSLYSVIVVVNGILTVVKQNPSSVRASVCACVCTFFSLFLSPVNNCRSMRIRLSLSLFSRAPDRELSQTRSRKRPSAPASAIMVAELKTNLSHRQVRVATKTQVQL